MKECQAILFDLSDRGRVEVTGADRVAYLHAVLTNSVKKLAEEEGCYTVFLTHEGRMVSDLFLYRLKDKILLDISPGRAEALLEGLCQFLITEDVKFKDVSGQLGMLSIQGVKASEILKAVGAQQVPEKELSCVQCELVGQIAVVARHSLGEEGFDLILGRSGLDALKEALVKAGALEGGSGAFERMRVQAGIPRFGIDMDEKTIPLEAGLEAAIDHDKGCYIGQEVVARIRDRGHVAKILVRLEIQGKGVPEKGADIFSQGRKTGQVTSAFFSPEAGKVIGMGYVKWESRKARDLMVQCGANRHTLLLR